MREEDGVGTGDEAAGGEQGMHMPMQATSATAGMDTTTTAKKANGVPQNKAIASIVNRPKATALDIDSVEMPGSRPDTYAKLPPRTDRPLGLSEAPTYYPSAAEFADPFAYIQSIAGEGQRFGIVKIVPPSGWKPAFAIDTERFYFRTRRQELNSVEGGNRAASNYIDQLCKFHKQSGYNLNRLPSIDKRPVDLYRLKKCVEMRGGFDQCSSGKKWAEVGREMGYTGKIMSSLSSSLRAVYQKYLLPYEEYLVRAKPSVQQQRESEPDGIYTPASFTPQTSPILKQPKIMGESSPPSLVKVENGATDMDEKMTFESDDMVTGHKRSASDMSPMQTRGSSKSPQQEPTTPDNRIKRTKLDKEAAMTVSGSNMSEHRQTNGIKKLNQGVDSCIACKKDDEDLSLIVCDGCNDAYHTDCVDPPLEHLPEYEWFCNKCLVGTGEFGFEDGGTYTLRQFQEKARVFTKHHFATSRGPWNDGKTERKPTSDEVENEFWRLVEDVDETVEVEYGADIHSTTHGSGFSTIERHPLDPYSTDPWNLNILPLHQSSLFRHISSDISGMTVPWLYVGMCFSTFCWHAEDHYTYSANYQHFGEAKTWYGVPGEDLEKFEETMRATVPDLFEQQPDLLFQLVTMLSPSRLKENGVRCYALDQHPGEFVITFPAAYHAGFNHGFNFNEAVNFAPPDWEPFGRQCVENYKVFHKPPVFSHDELLCTAAESDTSIKTALWLSSALKPMVQGELAARNRVREQFPGLQEEICDRELTEAEYQCSVCSAFCYLSQIVTTDDSSTSVQCLDHVSGPMEAEGKRTLRKRMSDEALDAMYDEVLSRSQLPSNWIQKLRTLMEENPRPTLKSLRSLLGEGEKIPFPMQEVGALREFVERANEWVEEATNFIAKKPPKRLKEKGRRPSRAEDQHRNPFYIAKLLQDADALPFEAPEIEQLRERARAIEGFQAKAREAMAHPTMNEATYVQMVEEGKELQVDLPEMEHLERYLRQLRWVEKARTMQESHPVISDLEELMQEAKECGVPEDHQYLTHFKELKESALKWEEKAKGALSQEVLPFEFLQQLFAQGNTLPASRETLEKIEMIIGKHRDTHESINVLLEGCKNPELMNRPKDSEAKRIMDVLRDLTVKPREAVMLEKERKKVDDWIRRGKRLFGKANAPLHILGGHLEYVQKRNEACFSLDEKPRPPVEPSSRENTPHGDNDDHTPGLSGAGREMFCICRQSEGGLMIECEVCHEWYHGRCLKIARGRLKDEEKYTCPICDYRVKIPRDSNRPRLEDLEAWECEALSLPFIPEELESAHQIVETARRFRFHLQPFLQAVGFTPAEVPIMRFYLRKIEGAEVLLAAECNLFRAELHKWVPIAPEPPEPIEMSKHTRKPRPTKQQKIMAELGITNPDDLPPHLRNSRGNGSATKKKKEEEAQAQARAAASASPSRSAKATTSNYQPYSLDPSLDVSQHANSQFDPALTGGPHPLFHQDHGQHPAIHDHGSRDMNNLFEALAHSGVSSEIFEHNLHRAAGLDSHESDQNAMDDNMEHHAEEALASFSHVASPPAHQASPTSSAKRDEDMATMMYLRD